MKRLAISVVAIVTSSVLLFGQNSSLRKSGRLRRSQPAPASILYSKADGGEIRVDFKQDEVELIRTKPETLLDKLRESDISCPEERKRVDTCTWACGDGSKVRTCNTSLRTALAAVWNKDRITHPQ
jgi:hypothetical protein